MRTSSFTRWWVLAALGAVAVAQTGARSQQAAAPPAVPPLVLEDFEGAALGGKPYLWKIRKDSAPDTTVGAERSALDGLATNKALKIEYAFPSLFKDDQSIDVGPQNMATPGSLTGLSVMVLGDGSKHAVALRVKDRFEETFEWQVPVTWMGWKKILFPMNPRTALRAGRRADGVMDLPLAFDTIRLQRVMGSPRKGEILLDNLTAECSFGTVTKLYDTRDGVKPETWRANKNRATIGLVADALVPLEGKDVSVLKMEYEYENGVDASVEYTRTLPTPTGSKHGTLIAEVFGDGSNNVLRFRMLDGQDHPWQATWANVLVDWAGWRTLYIDTRTLRDPAGQDPSAVMEKFPTKFYSLVMDDCSPADRLPGVESGRKGEVYLGRLLFCQEK